MKNTKLIWTVVAGIILILVVSLFMKPKADDINVVPVVINSDPLNTSYVLGDDVFSLKNGKAEISIDGSSMKNTLVVFGEPVYGDLDKDGDNDGALILVNNSGGSGTFYYAVLAINNDGVYKSTKTMLLGDRIAPQTVEIQDGHALYNFMERKGTDPMIAKPSISKSVWIYYNAKDNTIGEWVKDFEGEADVSKMNLNMKTWIWVKAEYSDGKVVTPLAKKPFTLTFKNDKTFSAATDCNGVGGEYTVNGNKITFNKMMSTLMYCEGSQEAEFTKMLNETQSFLFTPKGELVLVLKFDSGSVFFR